MYETLSRIKQRFWSRVVIGPGCWLWSASRNFGGYGQFSIKLGGKVITIRAHRVAYQLTVGSVHAPLLRHACDNPACCRPSHLLLGTHLDNFIDAKERGRWHAVGSEPLLDERDVAGVRADLASGLPIYEVARLWGVSPKIVLGVKRGDYGAQRDRPPTDDTLDHVLRVRLGQARARAEGKRLGAPTKPGPSAAQVRKLRREGKSWRQISIAFGCTPSLARRRAAGIG